MFRALLCSKHIEECNKPLYKTRICVLGWSFTRIITRCTVSKTKTKNQWRKVAWSIVSFFRKNLPSVTDETWKLSFRIQENRNEIQLFNHPIARFSSYYSSSTRHRTRNAFWSGFWNVPFFPLAFSISSSSGFVFYLLFGNYLLIYWQQSKLTSLALIRRLYIPITPTTHDQLPYRLNTLYSPSPCWNRYC